MRTGIALAFALGIGGLALGTLVLGGGATSVLADDDISNQFTVTATQKAGGKVDILIKPKSDKYFVNSDYGIKVHVDPKEGGKVSKADLGKDDGTYEKSTHEGKALSVTFHVDADKGLKGDGKLVICSLDACGNPTKFSFESK